MVKALTFKGDKKSKKRKRTVADKNEDPDAPPSKALVTTAATTQAEEEDIPEDDTSWVSATLPTDVSGPILLVLPSDPPTAISCDAQGTVFAIEIENCENNDPNTAEPHDVRQVWVANRIAGTEGFSFKGHHGKYLGCDQFGVLSAAREAISAEEQFNIVAVSGDMGGFAVQNSRERFLSTEEKKGGVTVRGDTEGIEFRSTLRIRMQAKFKPRMKIAKEEKAREKISRKELEVLAGRKLEEDEVKTLKRARREGNFHEVLLDVKVRGKHDKFA